MKIPFIIYANAEALLQKTNTYDNDPETSSITKANKHTTCGYSLFTHCSFDSNKNKHAYYRGKDCHEKLLERFDRTCNKNSQFRKTENVTINKKREQILS